MNNWLHVYYDHQQGHDNDPAGHCVIFEFTNKADAEEFLRLAKICKDVDDELLFYGDGVLRTLERKNAKRKRQHKSR